MLALSRKANESIVLGNDIEITILEIKGDQVKVGVSAPKSVAIYMQIQQSNKEAANEEIPMEALSKLL